MADPTQLPLPPPAAAPSPGWKTTELYIAMLLLAGLGTVIEQLIQALPSLAQIPNLPTWLLAVIPIAIAGLGFAAKGIASEYLKTRLALKLPTPQVDIASAVAAGAAAANASNDKVLAALNK